MTREVNDRKGLVIGGYAGSNDVDWDPSWIFRPRQANSSVLDLVSLKGTLLQASSVTCSSLTIGGNLAATIPYVDEQVTEAKAYTDTQLGGNISCEAIICSSIACEGDIELDDLVINVQGRFRNYTSLNEWIGIVNNLLGL